MDLKTYQSMDAVGLAELLRAKEVSPKELVELSVKRLEEVQPTLNAVTHQRLEKALSEAESVNLDQPLAGVPMLLKDASQSIKGEPITSGSRIFKNNIAKHDSNLVKRLRNAGLLFIGHTTTPEFGLKNISEPVLHGPVRNPWNTDYSPGGSSGGSAAAIASGVVPVAGASDGGGSIRIPASFSGLFGLKPTRGRTPVGPGAGRQWQGAAIDFVLSKSVRDSAAMLDILQVVQPEAAFQTPLYPGKYIDLQQQPMSKPLKIAFSTESPVGTPVSDDAKKAVHQTVKWLEDRGHHVEEKSDDVDGIELMRHYYLMNSGEISSLTKGLAKVLGRPITPDDVEIETWLLHVAGQQVSAAEFTESLAAWDRAAAQMVAFHETYDFYITPATAYPAPKVGGLAHSEEAQQQLREKMARLDTVEEQQQLIYDMFLPSLTYTPFTQLANLTGQPAMSLPLHVTDDGLPLGVQVMANKGEEDKLLRLAFELEQSELWIGMEGNPMMS